MKWSIFDGCLNSQAISNDQSPLIFFFCKCLIDLWCITLYDLRRCLVSTFFKVRSTEQNYFNTGLTKRIHSWFDAYFSRGENMFSIVWKHPLIKSVCFPFSFHLILFGSSLCIFCTLLMILMSDQLYEITLNNIFMILMYTHLCEITHDFIPTVLAVHTRFHRSWDRGMCTDMVCSCLLLGM